MEEYTHDTVKKRFSKLQENPDICDRNKELMAEFLSHLRADSNVGVRRQYKYVIGFSTILEKFMDMPLDEMRKDDMRRVIADMEASDYSDWYKHDFKTFLKRFYSTIWEDEVDRPDWVKKILKARFMKTSTNIERKVEQEVLEPEEVMAVSDAATNARDRLIPLFFFETGARIGEIMGVTLDDIDLQQKYADVEVISLKNDKGPRTLTLTRCVGLLQDWLEQHPDGDNPDAPLFASIGSHNRGERVSTDRIRIILTRLAEKAGIDKRVNPHTWRHSAATHYGMKWSATRMKYWFGWKDSSMADTYCHENEDRMRKEKLAEEGIDAETNGADATERQTCGRCGESWPPTQKYCGRCSLALNQDAAQEAKALKESVEDVTEERVNGMTTEDIAEQIAALQEQVQAMEG